MAERKPDHRGLTAQRAILAELRRRELAEMDPPGVRELARALEWDAGTVRYHLRPLIDDGLVTVRRNRGRLPSAVSLSAAGRRSADLSTPP